MANLRNVTRNLICSSKRFYEQVITQQTTSNYFRRYVLATRNSADRYFSSLHPKQAKESVNITYLNRDGEKVTVKAAIGENLLDIALDNDLDIDGFGACEGTLACSTCHLIFDQKVFDQLPSASDEEMDMLDLAYGLQETSRLGCQVCVTKDMNGMEVCVPKGVSDARDV
ncbi:adrenodoxin-like [Anneissia japonica]|uniref:adrenodoxin-like n=1 Tax=Anneissia japonica TaxID=1529436 RepID=UPI0014258434|nr:adrenodoxin-like [Anneissia japonica]